MHMVKPDKIEKDDDASKYILSIMSSLYIDKPNSKSKVWWPFGFPTDATGTVIDE